MDLGFITQVKNWLEKTRKDVMKKIKRLYKVPDFGNDVDSGDEESDESEEFGNQLAVAQKYKEHLADIDQALRKIDKQQYGICERCGKEISKDVLEAAPQSRLCKDCKKEVGDKK